MALVDVPTNKDAGRTFSPTYTDAPVCKRPSQTFAAYVFISDQMLFKLCSLCSGKCIVDIVNINAQSIMKPFRKKLRLDIDYRQKIWTLKGLKL